MRSYDGFLMLSMNWFYLWSGIRESNPRLKLGKLAYYHCTNPA